MCVCVCMCVGRMTPRELARVMYHTHIHIHTHTHTKQHTTTKDRYISVCVYLHYVHHAKGHGRESAFVRPKRMLQSTDHHRVMLPHQQLHHLPHWANNNVSNLFLFGGHLKLQVFGDDAVLVKIIVCLT